MFDAQCELAALVYERDQDPDAVLRDFAADLNARGYRAVGMVQAGQCADASLSAVLLPSGEVLALSQNVRSPESGCKLDLGRLHDAAARVTIAMDAGADVVIVNRFGKRERSGKGLADVIRRASDANIPVVIAVSREHFADWVKFADGMSVKLACDRTALDQWWHNVSMRGSGRMRQDRETVCHFK